MTKPDNAIRLTFIAFLLSPASSSFAPPMKLLTTLSKPTWDGCAMSAPDLSGLRTWQILILSDYFVRS